MNTIKNSSSTAIYYPHIKVKDPNLLKCWLLYFDDIKRIIPKNYDPELDVQPHHDIKLAIDAKAIRNTKVSKTRAAAAELLFRDTALSNMGDYNTSIMLTDLAVSACLEEPLNDKQLEDMLRESNIGMGIFMDMWDGKMSHALRTLMQKAGVGHYQSDGFFYLSKPIADIYMSCLATAISEELDYPLITDSYQYSDIGRFIRFGKQRGIESKLTPEQRSAISQLNVSFPNASQLKDVPMKKILEFRTTRRKERKRFRAAIGKILSIAEDIENEERRNDYMADNAQSISEAIEDQTRLFQDLTTQSLTKALCISAPTIATASFVLPTFAPIFGTLGVAWASYAWWSEMQIKEKTLRNNCPWQYLISLQEEVR